MNDPLLSIDSLKVYFPIYKGTFFNRKKERLKAVDGVNLKIEQGEVIGLVGESGCGKSTIARAVMCLTKATSGSITMEGEILNKLSPEELKRKRPEFQMVFQDPYASLNPRMTVYSILSEPLEYHKLVKRSELAETVSKLLEEVGLAPSDMGKYPHEFSGGQLQRIAIAKALALRPKLIIADEPVSALDVSIRSQVLNLLAKLIKKHSLTLLFISHDLSVIRHISDRIAVMYLGKIVELGSKDQVYSRPTHPYTHALLSAVPVPDPDKEKNRERVILQGEPPSPINPPSGCSFHPRCLYRQERCSEQTPVLESRDDSHSVACFYPLNSQAVS
ncbi:ABC transporter ATP-binding protein [Thermodesulfobacteriota bacterium]